MRACKESQCFCLQQSEKMVDVSLGMRHDGPEAGNSCSPGGFIMSPTLGSGKISWSSCSRQYLHRFLASSQAACLADRGDSQVEHSSGGLLPGQRFSADTQVQSYPDPTWWADGVLSVPAAVRAGELALWVPAGGRRVPGPPLPAAALHLDLPPRAGGDAVRAGPVVQGGGLPAPPRDRPVHRTAGRLERVE